MNDARRIWAVVPVKSFGRAKTRLAALLNSYQREQLARAMLEDVLAALQERDALAGILVVSQDADARQIATTRGARSLDDPFETGPNAAIRLALPFLRDAGAEAMIVVPADVPQIEADELAPVLQALRDRSIVIVPAARDGGTNLLGCSPMDIIAPCFGPESFAQHVSAARRAGIEPRILACRSLAHDIDRPQDIVELRAGQETRTGAYLARVLNGSDARVTACAR
jgi:2-phospho-L-lactate/phosphoenolpyruvate guanylyltransferase